jgi:hypothetical protein
MAKKIIKQDSKQNFPGADIFLISEYSRLLDQSVNCIEISNIRDMVKWGTNKFYVSVVPVVEIGGGPGLDSAWQKADELSGFEGPCDEERVTWGSLGPML